jgi:nucleotide-binding universal stress UspA family protein
MKRKPEQNKTILVGIDYTKSSENALKYGILLARKGRANLMLFHIYEAPVIHTNSGLFFISYQGLQATNTERLEKYQKTIGEKYPDIDIKIFTAGTSFNLELEKMLRSRKVQYIVLGLEAKSRISKFIYGSHGTSIAGKVNCPVIIVPENYRIRDPKTAVFAIDNVKTIHFNVLKKVKDFSSRFHIAVNNAHIKTPFEFLTEEPDRLKKLNLKVVESDEFSNGIAEYVRKNNKDMIIVLSKSHSVLYNLFTESNTKRIAFQSKVPVMSVNN